MQTFLSIPKFNKKLLYLNANTSYQPFINTFAYNQMVLTMNPSLSKPKLVEEGNKKWSIGVSMNSSHRLFQPSNLVSTPLFSSISKEYEIRTNASAQKASYEKIKTARNKITEFESLYNIASDTSIRSDLAVRIQEQKDIVRTNDKKIKALKRHTANQARMMAKKQKQLEEEGIVEQWKGARRPSIFAQNPDLLEHIHDCIEYGEANKKRRKIIIKVRTIKHLKDKLEEKYNLYIIQIQSVSRDEKSDHPDSHYCLTSVKSAQMFAATFHDYSIIISQDDKSKSIETINKPVSIPDHDFSLDRKMKLIPSVYLLINPNDTNDSFRSGHFTIYIQPEYFVGTTVLTHMADLISITNSEDYDEVICIEEKIKPLWVLLVDGRPDENPKHLKNIIEYCKPFCFLDLDYLTVHTHAPGQSSFNPVERSMAPLSLKLAGIVLSIDYYGTHLNSQGKVINEELAKENFRFSGEKLCDIWQHDQSYRRNVRATYMDTHIDIFDDDKISWQWIEDHCQICRYSLDIRKCRNINCFKPSHIPEATTLLQENNGFLLPMIKGHD
ncbi:6442_t:CDS:2 [Gigaspora margarita]|uniref:6442_t:CDS:1 n=1 Tax=Gigaspora margarita TaxID=4874 RepID=A0ABN7UTV9_GIGMA|nr:6442_t:CDS:2 [Gigaspora margarita]